MQQPRFAIKHLLLATTIIALGAAALVFLFGRGGAAADAIYDESVIAETISVSTNLKRDKRVMWQTVPSRSGDYTVAPVSAINASRRVFESLDGTLIGKDRDEVRSLIGYKDRPNYGYHGKFWDIRQHAYVYRFDCGSFGWQYNLYLDENRIVEDVEIRWIH